MTDHQVVSREEWQAAREELLKREKEHTHTGDVLARQRHELPWVAIDIVSQAPLIKLQAYKRRMGWSIPWVSAANTDFNFDFGASAAQEPLRPPGLDENGLPPIVAQNAAAAGTDIPGYLSESPAVSVFTLTGGAVYQTYATTWRGVEFLMNYYPILDRVPKGRDEGDAWQTWLRRHDEYDSQ